MLKRSLSRIGSAKTPAIGVMARASNQLITVAVTLLAIRFLNPEEFGSFAVASAFLILARNFLYTGPFEFLLKSKMFEADAAPCLVANTIVTAVVCAGSVPVAYLISLSSEDPRVVTLLLWLIPGCLIASYSAWLESMIYRAGKLASYYFATIMVELVGAVIVVACFYAGIGLMSLVIYGLVRSVMLAFLYRLIITPPTLHRPTWTDIRRVLAWSRARYASAVALFSSNYAGDFILAAIYTPGASGLYRASNRIVTAVSDVFAQPLRTMAQSKVSQASAKGDEASDQAVFMFSAFACIAWPGLVGLALLSDQVSTIMLGPQWQGTAPIIAVFCAVRALAIFDSANTATLVAYDRHAVLFRYQALSTVLSIGGILVMLPYGAFGAALAVLFAAVVTSSLITIQSFRIGGLRKVSIVHVLRLPILASLATGLGILLLKGFGDYLHLSNAILLILSVISGVTAWVISLIASIPYLKRAAQSLLDRRGQIYS